MESIINKIKSKNGKEIENELQKRATQGIQKCCEADFPRESDKRDRKLVLWVLTKAKNNLVEDVRHLTLLD